MGGFHAEAKIIGHVRPEIGELDQASYEASLKIVDKQFAKGGLRLAAFLNAAYSSNSCPA